jgi:hypothetical protein
VVAGRSKLPGGPTSTRCTFAKGTRVSKYLVGKRKRPAQPR